MRARDRRAIAGLAIGLGLALAGPQVINAGVRALALEAFRATFGEGPIIETTAEVLS